MKHFSLRSMILFFVAICFMVMSGQGVWNIAHAAKLEKGVIKVGYAGGINFIFGKQMLQAAQRG